MEVRVLSPTLQAQAWARLDFAFAENGSTNSASFYLSVIEQGIIRRSSLQNAQVLPEEPGFFSPGSAR